MKTNNSIKIFQREYENYYSLIALHYKDMYHIHFVLFLILGLIIANSGVLLWYLLAKFLNHNDIIKTGFEGYLTFFWGVSSNIFIFIAGMLLDCAINYMRFQHIKEHDFSNWFLGTIIFSLSCGIVAYIFYNSDLDPLYNKADIPYRVKELLSTFSWAYFMAAIIFLPFFLFKKFWNKIFDIMFLPYTYIWLFLTVFAGLSIYFFCFSTDEKVRGILAAIGFRSGIFLGLYFSIIKTNIEREKSQKRIIQPDIGRKHTVFISYAHEDKESALKLYEDLKTNGIEPWIDAEDILPGEKWKKKITNAIKKCNYFIPVISENSIDKRGFVQKELKYALEILDEIPDSDIYIIPVKIDECSIEDNRLNELHQEYMDRKTPSKWKDGINKIIKSIKKVE